MILEDALNRLQEVGTEWQCVAEGQLALPEAGHRLLYPHQFRQERYSPADRQSNMDKVLQAEGDKSDYCAAVTEAHAEFFEGGREGGRREDKHVVYVSSSMIHQSFSRYLVSKNGGGGLGSVFPLPFTPIDAPLLIYDVFLITYKKTVVKEYNLCVKFLRIRACRMT